MSLAGRRLAVSDSVMDPRFLRDGGAQGRRIAHEDPLEDLAAVARQMEAICDLDGVRRGLAGRGGVIAPAIPADEVGLAVLGDPRRNRRGGALREQVDDAPLLQIDAQGPVAMGPLEGKSVDA